MFRMDIPQYDLIMWQLNGENYNVKEMGKTMELRDVIYYREPACSKGVGQDHLQISLQLLWFCDSACLCILEEMAMLCDMLLSSDILICIDKPACITMQKIKAREIISSPRISSMEFVAEESSAWHCSESHCGFFSTVKMSLGYLTILFL